MVTCRPFTPLTFRTPLPSFLSWSPRSRMPRHRWSYTSTAAVDEDRPAGGPAPHNAEFLVTALSPLRNMSLKPHLFFPSPIFSLPVKAFLASLCVPDDREDLALCSRCPSRVHFPSASRPVPPKRLILPGVLVNLTHRAPRPYGLSASWPRLPSFYGLAPRAPRLLSHRTAYGGTPVTDPSKSTRPPP